MFFKLGRFPELFFFFCIIYNTYFNTSVPQQQALVACHEYGVFIWSVGFFNWQQGFV